MARGIKAVGDSVKAESGRDFMLHPRLGYLHSCPTNLGTGMRASVHVDLPGWTKEGLDALKKRCEELKVQHSLLEQVATNSPSVVSRELCRVAL